MLNTIIIKRPIMTERSMTNASLGWYTFAVAEKATKKQVRKEVERLFKVNVKEIRTEIVKGKESRVARNRNSIKKSDWKKVFVRLAPEQKIDLFEVAPTKEK